MSRDRPWYRRLAAQPLAEARVSAPDGQVYLVRVRKDSPLVGPSGDNNSDPVSILVDVAKTNLKAGGRTGWTIDVVAPPRGWGRERVLYTQLVGAQAIVVDVVLAITGALERGETLWPVE